MADRSDESQQRGNVALTFDEFTVEVNPDDIVRGGEKYVAGLRELGVNRVSMGVQSLDDKVLRWMNRRHNAATARRAYRLLHDGGIDNISIDLIFGFGDIGPGDVAANNIVSRDARPRNIRAGDVGADTAGATPNTAEARWGATPNTAEARWCATPNTAEARWCATPAEELWRQTIDEALNIGGHGAPPKHISAYQLSIEPGSALADMVADGRYTEPSDDLCARQYEILYTALAAAGYHHYEISNFALPGFEARHNSAYWHHTPYIGFGPAAHSLLNNGRLIRRWNRPDIRAYLRAAQTGDWTSITDSETLTPAQLRTEKIMLALRTDTGLDCALLTPASTNDFPTEAAILTNGPSTNDFPTHAEPRQVSEDPASTEAAATVLPTPASQHSPHPALDRLLATGALTLVNNHYRIPEDHLFISDAIISRLI